MHGLANDEYQKTHKTTATLGSDLSDRFSHKSRNKYENNLIFMLLRKH